MNGDADLVFIGAGFRFDGKGNGRFGELRGGIVNGRGFVAESFACRGFLQLGDSANISGMKLADFGELLALNDLDMLETFRKVAIVIDKRGVIFQYAAFYLEVVYAAGERIGKRFENKEGKRLAVIVLALDAVTFAAGIFEADLGVLIRVRENVSKKSEQAGGADIVQRGSHQHGKDFFSDDGFADGGDEIVDGNGAFAEKLFHHFVVAFGDHFNKFFVGFLGVISKGSGDFFNGRFSITAGSVEVRFHGHEINDAAESFFAPYGHLQ